MPSKRKNNHDSEAAGPAKKTRTAADVLAENSLQRNVGGNPRPTQSPFKAPITIKWPEIPPDSKAFRSIIQTTTRRTAEELGLPPGVPAPILAIPATFGVPTRPNCDIALPDLVLSTGVRPPWEQQPALRHGSPSLSVLTSPKSQSRPKSTPALASGAGSSSLPQMRRTSSTAAISPQVPSSSKLSTPRPTAQTDKRPLTTQTKAAAFHPFFTRVPKALPSPQPLPVTAKPPPPQPAPASQILKPTQNSPVIDHEPTPSFTDSSHYSPPSKVVPPKPVPLGGEGTLIRPASLGATSPPPPVSKTAQSPPQPRPMQVPPPPNPPFAAASPPQRAQEPSQLRPLRREETMIWPSSFGTQFQPPVSQTAHSPPRPNLVRPARPLPTQGQVSSQTPPQPIHSLPQRSIPIPSMPTPMPIPIPNVQPNNHRSWHHGGSKKSNARGPSYPPPQQQYHAPPSFSTSSVHSNKYHPGQPLFQGGHYRQQTHNPYYPPGALSGAQTPYAPTPLDPLYPACPTPAYGEYNPAQPSFARNGFGAGNQAAYTPPYMGQAPPENNGGYNRGWR